MKSRKRKSTFRLTAFLLFLSLLLSVLTVFPSSVYAVESEVDQIWGYEYIGDTRTVDVHIKRLREKIKDHDVWHIATIWGKGYKFEVK